MNLLANHAQRIAALEANQANSIQQGIVVAVREADNLLDIEVKGITLEKVPYHTLRAGSDGKSYWAPEVGESGTLLCSGGQAGNAVFIPGLNTVANPAPESDVDIFKLDFGSGNEIKVDGSETEIKRDNNTIKIDGSEIEIKRSSGSVKITVGAGLITAELEVSSTQIKGSIAGVGKILVNAALVNINGATFALGATNLLPTPSITYVPIPIT